MLHKITNRASKRAAQSDRKWICLISFKPRGWCLDGVQKCCVLSGRKERESAEAGTDEQLNAISAYGECVRAVAGGRTEFFKSASLLSRMESQWYWSEEVAVSDSVSNGFGLFTKRASLLVL